MNDLIHVLGEDRSRVAVVWLAELAEVETIFAAGWMSGLSSFGASAQVISGLVVGPPRTL
jgi:hypothetical protein